MTSSKMERFAKIANGLPLTIFARRFVLGDVLVSLLLTLKIPCASVSIVDFERVNVCWFPTAIRSNLVKTYSKSTIKTRTVCEKYFIVRTCCLNDLLWNHFIHLQTVFLVYFERVMEIYVGLYQLSMMF